VLPLATILGAGLLFLIQPIIARFILPWFGGAPAVWTTSLLFFQTMLLAGYAYAHWLERRFGGGSVRIHAGLLAASALLLPITPGDHWAPPDPTAPVGRILWLLTATVGLPYFLLAATAPLIQARAAAMARARPYRLYAWSNAGSMGALLAFPLLVEPLVGARAQTTLWSWAYGAFAMLLVLALAPTRHAHAPPTAEAGAPPGPGDRLRWVVYPAAGTGLLMGVSEAIAEDLSVTPVFWVVPLGLYLLSYVIVFAEPRWVPRKVWAPLFVGALAGLTWLINASYSAHWQVQLAGYCAALLIGCVLLHGELVRARPGSGWLTAFYLWSAAGGAIGGLLVGVVGPLLLPLPMELNLVIFGAWLFFALDRLGALPTTTPREGPRLIVTALSLALLVPLAWPVYKRLRGGAELHRTFFGALHVRDFTPKKASKAIRHLLDGRISHGFQWLDPAARMEPTAYFVRHSGIGRALSVPGQDRIIGVIGLGVGTLAAYGRAGDTVVFYEINPAVIEVADTRFSFLADTPAATEVVAGDGRLSLDREPNRAFNVLALDAFSGDAIPTHLLTHEAMALYLRHLRPEGVLAVNVSNRHADLTRVVRAHAETYDLKWVWIRAHSTSPVGTYRSDWMLLSRQAQALTPFAEAAAPLKSAGASTVAWTDDWAPVLPLLR
jgi:SAM-dependent methyltransferase